MTKMNPKQKAAGGLDLMNFIQGADPQDRAGDDASPATDTAAKRSVGRPAAPAQEVRSKNLQIKLTEAEYNALKDKAGRIPLAVYMRDCLKEADII